MIQVEVASRPGVTAILADVPIAAEDIVPRKANSQARQAVVGLQHQYSRYSDFPPHRTNRIVTVLGAELGPILEIEEAKLIVQSTRNATVEEHHSSPPVRHVDRLVVPVKDEDVCVAHSGSVADPDPVGKLHALPPTDTPATHMDLQRTQAAVDLIPKIKNQRIDFFRSFAPYEQIDVPVVRAIAMGESHFAIANVRRD